MVNKKSVLIYAIGIRGFFQLKAFFEPLAPRSGVRIIPSLSVSGKDSREKSVRRPFRGFY